MEIKNDAEKKLILALLEEKSFDSYSEMEKATGKTRKWIKVLLPKFRDKYKIIDYDSINSLKFSVKKNKIRVKRFSVIKSIVEKEKMELNLLKEYILPVTIGIFVTFLLSIPFGINFIIFIILGGLPPFLLQFAYGCYKILTSKETITKIFIPKPKEEKIHIK